MGISGDFWACWLRVGKNVVKAGYFFAGWEKRGRKGLRFSRPKISGKIRNGCRLYNEFCIILEKLQKGKVGFFAAEAGYVWIFLTLSEAADFSSMRIFGLLAQGWEICGQSGLLFRGLGKT